MATSLPPAPQAGHIADAVSGLNAARAAWRDREPRRHQVTHFPSLTALAEAMEHISAALFPVRLGKFRGGREREDAFVAASIGRALTILKEQVESETAYWQAHADTPFEPDHAETILRLFVVALPEIRVQLDADIEAAFTGDPAARSVDEILVSYPGALAILYHRVAHQLHQLGAVIVARFISELANARTGIDIHPGATIGPRFFIDHGTGVVIGETAIIGRNVRLYQHVTLGARSPLGVAPAGPRTRHARHPIVEDDVTIYAGATILGRVTIGRGSVIGGNVWLLDDVPPDSVVAQPGASVLPGGDAAGLSERLHGREP